MHTQAVKFHGERESWPRRVTTPPSIRSFHHTAANCSKRYRHFSDSNKKGLKVGMATKSETELGRGSKITTGTYGLHGEIPSLVESKQQEWEAAERACGGENVAMPLQAPAYSSALLDHAGPDHSRVVETESKHRGRVEHKRDIRRELDFLEERITILQGLAATEANESVRGRDSRPVDQKRDIRRELEFLEERRRILHELADARIEETVRGRNATQDQEIAKSQEVSRRDKSWFTKTGAPEVSFEYGRDESRDDSRARAELAYVKPYVKQYSSQEMEQIHVLGADIRGRYITHALAGFNGPPVKYLIHRPHIWNRWIEEGRRLELYRGTEVDRRDRVIAEYVVMDERPPPGATLSPDDEPIHNLIVTVPAVSVNRAIEPIRHRLSCTSNICLIQDGLGVAEALVDALFPDPLSRPTILLGHLDAHLDYTNDRRQFGVALRKPGSLHLVAYGKSFSTLVTRASGIVTEYPPIERQTNSLRLLRMLVAVPGLYAGGYGWEAWLVCKLPETIFRCVADPLQTILDVDYRQIPRNDYARQLMDDLMGDIIAVIAKLPETRDPDRFWRMWRAGGLRYKVMKKLTQPRNHFSPMRHHTLRGLQSDADFLLGYFIKRGRELGVKNRALSSVLWMVKARHQERFRQARQEVVFAHQIRDEQQEREQAHTRRRPSELGWGVAPEKMQLEMVWEDGDELDFDGEQTPQYQPDPEKLLESKRRIQEPRKKITRSRRTPESEESPQSEDDPFADMAKRIHKG